MHRTLLLLFVLLLVACGPSDADIQQTIASSEQTKTAEITKRETTIAATELAWSTETSTATRTSTTTPTPSQSPTPTQSPTPSQTPTTSQIPTSIDGFVESLDEILFKTINIPGRIPGDITSTIPPTFSSFPSPVYYRGRQIMTDLGESAGSISVLIYDNQEDVDTAFREGGAGIDHPHYDIKIGDQSAASFVVIKIISGSTTSTTYSNTIYFTLCNAVVHIFDDKTDDAGQMVFYALNLLQRLEFIACP